MYIVIIYYLIIINIVYVLFTKFYNLKLKIIQIILLPVLLIQILVYYTVL